MKKIEVIIVVIFMLITFTGCGQVKSLSGKYVNEQDSSEYLKFSGESTVVLCADGEKITGTYSIYKDAAMLMFGSGDNVESVILGIKNKNTLILNIVGVAYVKKTFWNYYWKKILLYGTIGFIVLAVIGNIINKKEKHNDTSTTTKQGLKAIGEELAKSAAETLNETIDEIKEDMKM